MQTHFYYFAWGRNRPLSYPAVTYWPVFYWVRLVRWFAGSLDGYLSPKYLQQHLKGSKQGHRGLLPLWVELDDSQISAQAPHPINSQQHRLHAVRRMLIHPHHLANRHGIC